MDVVKTKRKDFAKLQFFVAGARLRLKKAKLNLDLTDTMRAKQKVRAMNLLKFLTSCRCFRRMRAVVDDVGGLFF